MRERLLHLYNHHEILGRAWGILVKWKNDCRCIVGGWFIAHFSFLMLHLCTLLKLFEIIRNFFFKYFVFIKKSFNPINHKFSFLAGFKFYAIHLYSLPHSIQFDEEKFKIDVCSSSCSNQSTIIASSSYYRMYWNCIFLSHLL